MGTRGAVCFIDDEGKWSGAYNHYDSYPSGLGESVWGMIRKVGVDAVIGGLQQYGRWERFVEGGKLPKAADKDELFDPRGDALFMEWVYVLDPIAHKMYVWESTPLDEAVSATTGIVSHNHDESQHYTHQIAAVVDLGGDEPDWDNMCASKYKTVDN